MNREEPLVSLLMPAWKPRRDWLRLAVKSALDQRGCRIELVVVDDGSPEPVERLLDGISDPRLRVMRMAHKGACAALNFGLPSLQGDYVRYIDADDLITPYSSARLLALTNRGEKIAYGATVFCDEDLKPRWRMVSRLEGWIEEECLLGRFTVRPQTLLFPRRVVEATGEWDPEFRVSYDWDYILRALQHAPVRGDTTPAHLYRRHPGGATASLAAGEAGASLMLSKYLERHPEQRGTLIERRARAVAYALAARAQLTHGHPMSAVTRMARAVALDPTSLMYEAMRSFGALSGRFRNTSTLASSGDLK